MINFNAQIMNSCPAIKEATPNNKRAFLVLILCLMASFSVAQDPIKITITQPTTDSNLQDVLEFENTFVGQLEFEGKSLNGKCYTITLDEYKDGEKINTSILLDGTEDEIFQIKGSDETLKFIFKCSSSRLKTVIRGRFFASKKNYSRLLLDEDLYAVKDFLGNRPEIKVSTNGSHALFAIITPTIHKDGSASYCEVAQSGIAPKDLGKTFNIQHYYIVKIEFKSF